MRSTTRPKRRATTPLVLDHGRRERARRATAIALGGLPTATRANSAITLRASRTPQPPRPDRASTRRAQRMVERRQTPKRRTVSVIRTAVRWSLLEICASHCALDEYPAACQSPRSSAARTSSVKRCLIRASCAHNDRISPRHASRDPSASSTTHHPRTYVRAYQPTNHQPVPTPCRSLRWRPRAASPPLNLIVTVRGQEPSGFSPKMRSCPMTAIRSFASSMHTPPGATARCRSPSSSISTGTPVSTFLRDRPRRPQQGGARATSTPATTTSTCRRSRAEATRALDTYDLLVIPGLELTYDHDRPEQSAHGVAVSLREHVSVDDGIEEALARARERRCRADRRAPVRARPARRARHDPVRQRARLGRVGRRPLRARQPARLLPLGRRGAPARRRERRLPPPPAPRDVEDRAALCQGRGGDRRVPALRPAGASRPGRASPRSSGALGQLTSGSSGMRATIR